jgi:hypothetical protein
MSVCGEKAGGMLGSSGYADGAKVSEPDDDNDPLTSR